MTGEDVAIENFSMEAFGLMINYIYGVETNWFEDGRDKIIPEMIELAETFKLERFLQELQLCW